MSARSRRSPFATRLPAAVAVAVAMVLAMVALSVGLVGGGPAGAAAATSRYVPITPVRVLDTRIGLAGTRLAAGGTVSVQVVTAEVAARAGVAAADVTAVVVNVTAVGALRAGYLTVFPQGEARPEASVLNPERAGQVLANTVTARVSPSGGLSIYDTAGGDVIVDVQGVYVSAASATAGRLVPFGPTRLLDTRATRAPMAAGEARVVDLRSVGVPATASAAVVNLTATNTTGSGYFTVWSGAEAQPYTSNLNVERSGQTIANQVLTALDGGRMTVFTTAGADVIVDVAGYYTGAADATSSDGLFVAMTPWRLLDTRGATWFGAGVPLWPGGAIDSGLGQLPTSGVAALAGNLTMTSTLRAGYLTAWAARIAMPGSSSVNATAGGQTIANHLTVPVSPYGADVFSDAGSHVILDVSGYFTGTPTTPTTGAPSNGVPPAQPSSPPSTGPHTFLFPLPGGGHARWDPCDPVTYVVNDDAVTPAHRAILEQSITNLEAATGLDFVYAGETTALSEDPPSGIDAILVFNPGSFAPAGVLGRSGAYFTYSGRLLDGSMMVRADIPADDELREVITHELAHLVGLDHVDDAGQIMYPYAHGVTAYQSGDREGLWWVGAAHGCLAPSNPRAVETATPVFVDD